MITTFSDLGVPAPIVGALAEISITEPFPIQAAVMPDGLAGRDVSGRAPTGSGKTLAFGIPVIVRAERAKPGRPTALILAPTRELAEQIGNELAAPAAASKRRVLPVYGGVGYGPQKQGLRRGADILVATPGRLEDLIEQGVADLREVGVVVVDEADRMADMGFLPAVRRLLDRTAPQRQTLLFSATLDGAVAALSRDYQRDPVRHEADGVEPAALDVRHHFWLVPHADRIRHTADVIESEGRSIVFTRTRHGADRLARQLGRGGVDAAVLHGGRSQRQRTRALDAFSGGKVAALVATDVAARGIHVDDVASVIHFDLPADSKDYVHRSGRTGRAGATGTIVSLVPEDRRREAGRIQRDLGLEARLDTPEVTALRNVDAPSRRPKPPLTGSRPTPAQETPNRERSPNGDGERAASNRTRTRQSKKSQKSQRGKTVPRSIYVANLPWSSTAADVSALFGRYGKVHNATIITDRRSGRSKGFGFVDMAPPAAGAAIDALHGSKLGGRDLTVRFARPRRYGN